MTTPTKVILTVCKRQGRDFRVAGEYDSAEVATQVGDALLAAKAAIAYRVTAVLAEKFLPAVKPAEATSEATS